MPPVHIARFDSATPAYSRAFHTFLSHTDQKEKALGWLTHEIESLPRKDTAIDAGAGTGKLTAWLSERFKTVIGVEPNPTLADDFRTACPQAVLIPETILTAELGTPADFILCSHVFYYVPRPDWEATVRRLIGWLAPGGMLAIALQNPDTDCMRMVDHFIGGRFDLGELAAVAGSAPGGPFDVRLDTVQAHIQTDDLQTACEIAEFVLNVLPMPSPPLWSDLEAYVAARFARPEGGYRLSCHQDFLRIVRAR
ncbi:class I SAM-dependent methyltransferase [Zavarzinella formosa]|uniref:class I SAM-dependent methyltransferase n=1 Tax=Zavarzinella formosa TaxID=360055 RepID=UPI0002E8AAFB|nr:class I SAM-dependent methyltransferase [Zavarzinella formosa]